jgi:hypothetical protein
MCRDNTSRILGKEYARNVTGSFGSGYGQAELYFEHR